MSSDQERGRASHRAFSRLRSLSPPQRAKSRSRSRERIRPRDSSPFSNDSRFSTNYNIGKVVGIGGMPGNIDGGNSSKRHTNVPIMEDDELDIQMSPMLPVFSANTISQRNVTTSDLDEILLPARSVTPVSTNQAKRLINEVEEDFQKQFAKDTELKRPGLKKNKEKQKSSDSADSEMRNVLGEVPPGDRMIANERSNPRTNRILSNYHINTEDRSSTDYSTDSGYEEEDEIEPDERQPYSKKSSSIHERAYQMDHGSTSMLDSGMFENPFPTINDYPQQYGQHAAGDEAILIDKALKNIDDKQDQSQPSSVLQWLHSKMPYRTGSIGQAVRAATDPDLGTEEHILKDLGKKKRNEDLESGVRSNILKISNKLLHGKPIGEVLDENGTGFDDVLGSFRRVKEDGKMKPLAREGITSNLMKLYHVPFSSASSSDELTVEEDSDDGYEKDNEEQSNRRGRKSRGDRSGRRRSLSRGRIHRNQSHSRSQSRSRSRGSGMVRSTSRTREISKAIKSNIPTRLKPFQASSSLFGSRDSSREPLTSRARDGDDNNLEIKLPEFTLAKEDKKLKKIKKKAKKQRAARITVHIVDLLHRQEFLLTLCKAFMLFGAPNHRLEEYMALTAKVLEVEATFIYLPGMMLVNFSDPVSKTSDLKLVRVGQGLNLEKLDLAHDIYENVVHDRVGVDDAMQLLEELFESKDAFNVYWIIIFYGLSSMFILVFFNGAWLDMIPSFILGSLLGFLQCVIAPKNALYSSVFEVGSAIIISFVARAVGSIAGGKYFCFSAVVLSGLCMILPGYMILRGALEIQSKSVTSGVVGMMYAIIYSLFLGFGLTLGSAIYGWIDKNAYSQTTCSNMGRIGNIWKILFVPLFNIFQGVASQARFHQLSIMVVIACAGYVVTYFTSTHLSLAQLSSALGSFTVGVLSIIYDKWLRGYHKLGHCSTKFTCMICGIFDLVPGGMAARNVLAEGLGQLNQTVSASAPATPTGLSGLSFGVSMMEIAIGITVGLFAASVVSGGYRGEASIGL